MKISKIISIILAVALFTLCFSACGTPNGQGENPIDEAATAESDEENVEMYVTMEETDTGFGLMTIPTFSQTKLNKESAAMANKMFADIHDDILENIEEFKAITDDAPSKDEQAPPLCTVKTALVGTTLSVLAEYNYYFSSPKDFFVAVNFDTKTGEAISPREAVKSAGYTEDEVKAALRSFADRSLFNEWERSAFDKLAETKSVPDGWGDPSYAWQDALDDMEREYDAEQNPSGEEWDELPCYPTVFVDENVSLFVGANIPTEAGDGFWTTMVQIGHSDAQTLQLNAIDRNGEKYNAHGAMDERVAFEAAAFTMGLNEKWETDNGAKCEMEVEYIDSIEDTDGISEVVYIIKVFTDQGTHISTVARYAVGVFTATVWEYDVAADKWDLRPNGTGYLPEDIYTGMQQDAILAAVYNEPNELEKWCVSTVDEVDLIESATSKSLYESEGETALIFAKTNNTRIVFVSGTMNGDSFEKDSELRSVTLNSGESVLVHMQRPEGIPSQAIIVEAENDTGCDIGTYVVEYRGQEGTVKTEYITSDSAMG